MYGKPPTQHVLPPTQHMLFMVNLQHNMFYLQSAQHMFKVCCEW